MNSDYVRDEILSEAMCRDERRFKSKSEMKADIDGREEETTKF